MSDFHLSISKKMKVKFSLGPNLLFLLAMVVTRSSDSVSTESKSGSDVISLVKNRLLFGKLA